MRGARRITAALSILAAIGLASDLPPYSPSPVTDAERARASAYLDEHFIPLPDWSWNRFDIPGGFVRYGTTSNTDAAATILFIPGYTTQAELFGHAVQAWLDRGYRVVIMEMPGQGGSSHRARNPEKAWTGNFSHYARDVAAFVRHIKATTDKTLIAYGESFGGHAILRAATDFDFPADGIIVNAPALELYSPGYPPWFAKSLMHGAPAIGFGKSFAPGQGNWQFTWQETPESFGCGVRPDRLHIHTSLFALHPEHRVGGVTLEWVAGLERSGAYLAAGKKKHPISVPVTMIFAENDTVVKNERPQAMCANHVRDCTTHVIKNAQHCSRLEPNDRIEEMFTLIDKMVEKLAP